MENLLSAPIAAEKRKTERSERPLALVTGSGSGIGLAYAKALARRGYDLLLVSIEEQPLKELARELSATFAVRALPFTCDLARAEAAKEVYDYCEAAGLEVEVLVNNAGIFFFNDLTETSPALISKMMLLHMHTVTLLCHYFGARMKRRGHGYILNMSSLSAWTPAPGISVYAASKSYLRKLSQMLRYELYDSGVGVTSVCPGAVDTGLYNLSDRYRRLAVQLGVMMPPERLVERALHALFARRDYIIPGRVNRFFVVLVYLLPAGLIRRIKRTAKFYRYGG